MGRRIRRIISHFEPFVKYFFRIVKNFFDPSVRRIPSDYTTFLGVCQVKSSSSRKIFLSRWKRFHLWNFSPKKFFDFSILPDLPGFVKSFFQKQQKFFCQVFFQKKKKKKIVPPLLYHISWALSSLLRKIFWKTFLLLKAFSSWHKGKNML